MEISLSAEDPDSVFAVFQMEVNSVWEKRDIFDNKSSRVIKYFILGSYSYMKRK